MACAIASLIIAHHPVAHSQSLDGETSPSAQPDAGELANRELRLDYSTSQISLQIALPEVRAASKRAQREVTGNGPLEIGYARQLPREFRGDLSSFIEWTTLDDGSIVAALSITSPGASAMRVGIRAELVPGAEIRFFGAETTADDVQEVTTSREFPVVTQADFLEGGEPEVLWSPSVESETLGIEITLPSREALATFFFRIEQVSHIYVPLSSQQSLMGTDCDNHIDVQCRAGSISNDRDHAVGRISFVKNGFSYACSGTLLSDDEEDTFIPHFLTANHCVSTGSVARTVETRWFFQNANCGSTLVDERVATTYGGADLLATSVAQDSTLLRLKRGPPGGLLYSGWSARSESHPISVYGIHHPAGGLKKYSAGTTTGQEDVEVCEDPVFDIGCSTVRDAIHVDWNEGTVEGGSSGSGLFRGQYLIGTLSGGEGTCAARTAAYGPFSTFYPRVSQWLGVQSATSVPTYVLPLVLPASSTEQQGFVRIINRSEQAGTVAIRAIDDTGWRSDSLSLSFDPMETKHLSSSDLERGNASIGLSEGVGDGTGYWRLELSSELAIEPVAYARSDDGLVVDIHEAAVEETGGAMRYRVPIFNPASNLNSQSRLRLINPGDLGASIVISGLDDLGESPSNGDVRLSLTAGAAQMLTARQLEEGGEGISGAFGSGTGKWQLSVSSSRPIQVMSLVRNSTGLLTNLSRGQAESPVETTPPPPNQQPDLIVQALSVSDTTPDAGQTIRVGVTVRNQGGRGSASTTLRIYRSSDATVSTADNEVRSLELDGLPSSGAISMSASLSAPSDAGTYYYGACVDFVSGESDTTNNCSSAVAVTVPGPVDSQPDLVVESPAVSSSNPDAGQSVTLSVRVRNQGDGASAPTALRYFRSSDEAISTADAEVGSSAVNGLAASDSVDGSFSLNVPLSAGTYYYGACATPVTGESDTTNNCSSAVTVTVASSPMPPASSYYGAFALHLGSCTEGDYSVGLVADRLTEQEALDAARQACQSDGGSDDDCRNAHSFRTCLAIGYGSEGANGCSLGPSRGATLADAEAKVLAFCRDLQGFTNCSVVASACNSPTPPPPPDPQADLVVESPTVSSSNPNAGQAITLGATVRNQGDGEAASTTLRFYRSSDGTISASDAEIGTSAVSELAASSTSDASLGVNAPSDAGTYYYGACVDAVADESDTTNNCSSAIEIVVPQPASTFPDLVVESPSVSNSSQSAGQALTLSATVRNQGDGDAAATTLRYYRSSDATISTADTQIDTDSVSGLTASGSSDESVGMTAPLSAGTYHYGACVDPVAGESDTTNNCSTSVALTVPVLPASQPDLVVESPTVSDSSPDAGEAITLSATVRNQGDGDAAATTVRFYRSSDATISAADTEVGTNSVSGLNASASSNESLSSSVPSDSGTYYYGACVDSVSGESDTTNNCSTAATVTVSSSPVSPSSYYGAFALRLHSCAAGHNSVGLVTDRLTEQEALDAARQACQNDGGSAEDCLRAISFRRCMAIGYGIGGATGCSLGPWGGDTLAEAEANRLSFCRDQQGFTSCSVVTSACNSQDDDA